MLFRSIDSKRKQEIKSLAITSCTHIEFLNLLGELSSVKGVCNPELIYNESLLKRVAQGEVISLGDAFNTNIERLLLLNPDALMMSSYNQQDENSKRIEAAGIPVIYNNEWMESTLLGRAEWIKLIGAFYGQDQLADSLFNVMESAYLNAMQLTSELKDKPSVMAGGNFKGTWYMPSGASYMGRLFDDAGAHYRYANEMSAGSLPLNFETVLHEFANCDIWLNAPTQSMQELMEMDSRHGLFEPAKQGRVYGFYNRINEQGGNDFWESAVAHPDIVLQDVIWAIYPELMENYVPTYISKLN